jgi:hypothetical protein
MLSFKSTTTESSISSKVVNFLSLPSIYICIAKPTEWSYPYNDELIPEPNLKTSIDSPIAYIKPKRVQGIYRSPCGSLSIGGQTWAAINIEDIKIEDSVYKPNLSHVHIEVDISPNFYNTDSFRIIGVYTHTQLKYGVNPNLISYEPVFIANAGVLHWIAYSTPIQRLENKTHNIDLLISL